MQDAVVHGCVEHIEHERKAGVAAGHDILGRHVQELGTELPRLGNAAQVAVVAHIRAVFGGEVAVQDAVEFVGKV